MSLFNPVNLVLHSAKQAQVLKSKLKIILLACGIQYGKTVVGSAWLKRLTHMYRSPTDSFILTAPNYKIMMQSSLPVFLHYMKGFGKYNKVDSCFKIHGGGTVYMRTATDPDSVVGITDVRGVWGDEAGLYSLYFWENMQARAAFKDAPILLTTSPYALNWIYKDIIKPKRKGLRPDIELIQAASIENPYFPREVYEQRKATMDPRRFNMIFGGEWHRMEGLVYDCFEEDYNVCKPFILPKETIFYAGVDWGHRDPFVIKVMAILPNGERYFVSEFYKSGLTPSEIKNVMKSKQVLFNIIMFFCDPSRPDLIKEMNSDGLVCISANNDIKEGVSSVYELYKSRKLKVFDMYCPHSIDEIEAYHYPNEKEVKVDANLKEAVPVDQNNHCMDADRYVVLGVKYYSGKNIVALPNESVKNIGQETPEEISKRIRKRKQSEY